MEGKEMGGKGVPFNYSIVYLRGTKRPSLPTKWGPYGITFYYIPMGTDINTYIQ